jgi:hypothetical protein
LLLAAVQAHRPVLQATALLPPPLLLVLCALLPVPLRPWSWLCAALTPQTGSRHLGWPARPTSRGWQSWPSTHVALAAAHMSTSNHHLEDSLPWDVTCRYQLQRLVVRLQLCYGRCQLLVVALHLRQHARLQLPHACQLCIIAGVCWLGLRLLLWCRCCCR